MAPSDLAASDKEISIFLQNAFKGSYCLILKNIKQQTEVKYFRHARTSYIAVVFTFPAVLHAIVYYI